MFKPAAESWGVGPVLVVCAFISLAGGMRPPVYHTSVVLTYSLESDMNKGISNCVLLM